NDDAGFLALQLLRAGELAAEKFNETARAGAPVGAQNSHAEQKHEQLKNIGILNGTSRGLLGLLFCLCEKGGKRIVQFVLESRRGRLLVNDAGDERFVRLGEGLQRGEDV